MFKKEVVTKENYREIVLKRAIISCWIILTICFVIKIFGGNFFAIVCNLNGFNKFCEFCERYYISLFIQFASYLISMILIISCMNFNCKKYKWFIIIPLLVICWVMKTLVSYGVININFIIYDLIDFIICYICCILTYNKNDFNIKNIIKPLFFILLLFIFSLVSAITKDIGIKGTINCSFMIGFIFMIDYYIMIILTYLYLKRRSYNG